MKEVCVLCGKETEYNKKTLIKNRYRYIVGGGQICRNCYEVIYEKNSNNRK